MPAQKAVIAIPIGVAGIDTRTDPKAMAPPALAACENGSFATPGRIEKRAGGALIGQRLRTFVSSTTQLVEEAATGSRSLMTMGDELLLVRGDDTASYNSTLDRWATRGPLHPIGVSHGDPMVGGSHYWEQADVAVADGLEVVATASPTTGGNWVHVRDVTTGVTRSYGSLAGSQPRTVAVGNTVLIFFLGTTVPYRVAMWTVSRSRLPLMTYFGGPTTNVTTADVDGTAALYDVAVSEGRVLLTYYATGGDIKYGYVAPDGTLDGSLSNFTPASTPTVLTCCVEATTRRFALAWGMDGNSHLDSRIFAEDKSALVASTTVDASATGFKTLGAAFDPDDTGKVFAFYQLSAASEANHIVRVSSLTTGAVTALAVTMQHAGLVSKPWRYGSGLLVVLAHVGTLQRHAFACRLATAFDAAVSLVVVAHVLRDDAAMRPLPHLSQVAARDGTSFAWAAAYKPLVSGQVGNWSARVVDLDMDIPIASTEAGAAAFVPAGVLWRVDATTICEAGFLLYPELVTGAGQVGTGALTALGTYLYLCRYEVTYASGEEELSSAVPITVTLAGSQNEVVLTIPTLSFTSKYNPLYTEGGHGYVSIGIVVYRANPGETIFYRVSSPDRSTLGAANGWVGNDHTLTSKTFTDRLADDAILTFEADDLSGDPPEVENIPPGPCSIIASGNNRVYVAGGLNHDEVRFSKLRDQGEPLTFSDELAISIDAGDGPLTALATMGDALVAFRERQTYIVGGDGPDNTGLGGTFNPPRTLSDDIGCIDPRSVVRIPSGIMFQSRKGIYLLAGEQLAYVGAPVEGELQGETITSAVALSDIHEVRFGLASGKALVFHYLTGQWSTASYGGLGAVLWRNQYTYLADSTGTVRVEGSTYTDDGVPYQFAVETPWIRLGAMQGYQLARRVLFLGSYRGAHAPQIRIAYDYEDAWIDTFEWDPTEKVNAAGFGDEATMGADQFGGETGGLPSTGVYQFQVWCSQPRCQAIKIRIEDRAVAGGGVMGDSFTLSEIAIEIAQKPGPMRLGAEKTA